MIGGMGSAVTPDLSKGGEIDGDLVITGDFKVEGAGSFAYDEIIEGSFKATGGAIKAASGDTSFIIDSLSGQDAKLTLKSDAGGANEDWWTFRADNDQKLYIRNGNTDLHAFTSAGAVGIGGTPSAMLHIKGANDNSNGQLKLESTGTDARIHFINSSGDSSTSGNADILMSATSGYEGLRFMIDNSDKMIIDENGRIGIGTVSPSSDYALTIQQPTGTNKDYILGIQDNGSNTAFRINTDSGDNVALRLFNGSGAEKIAFDAGGASYINNGQNFGIGTASPTLSKLQINTSSSTRGLVINATDSNASYMQFSNSTTGTSTSQGLQIGLQVDESAFIDLKYSSHLAIATAGTERMRITSAGQILIPDGGRITPSIAFASDTNVGIYKYDADALAISCGGNARFVVDTNSRISLSNNDSGTGNTIFGKTAGNAIQSGGNYNILLGEGAGSQISTGDNNVAIGGLTSLASQTTSSNNIGIGHSTLRYNVTGASNTAIGGYSQRGVSGNSHSNNTSVGYNSLYSITTGSNNVALGFNAGYSITTPQNAVAIGAYSNYHNTTGWSNVAVGSQAILYNETGEQNVAIGRQAMMGVSGNSHSNNTAVGTFALKVITTGNDNVVVGSEAGDAITTATENTIVGRLAGSALTTGGTNVAVGSKALQEHLTGIRNIAIGAYSMGDTNSGTDAQDSDNNIFIGYTAGGGAWANAKSENNVAIGSNVMQGVLNGANNNTALGYFALASITSGDTNVGIGAEAGGVLTTSIKNTILGYQAGGLISHVSASDNVLIGNVAGKGGTGELKRCIVIGSQAMDSTTDQAQTGTIAIGHATLSSLTSGSGNTAVGYSSLGGLTTGSQNTFLGYGSGDTFIGDHSVGIGYHALKGSGSNTNNYNTAIGSRAMDAVTTGSSNVAVGFDSLGAITTGSNNVAIGSGTGDAITTDSNVVAIGYGAYSANDVSADAEGSSGHGSGNIAIGYQSMQSFNHVDFLRNTAIGFQTMSAGTSDVAQDNTSLGYRALQLVTTGNSNVAVGSKAGKAITTANNSTAVGYGALQSLTAGNSNSAIGYESSKSLSGGAANITLGYRAMLNATNISSAIFIGANAGDAITSSTNPNGAIGIGYNALTGLTSGSYNTVTGYEAGKSITTGDKNTLYGYRAGGGDNGIDTLSENTFIGYNAGLKIDSGSANTAIGSEAMESSASDSDASNNIAVGKRAMYSLSDGDANVSIGNYSGDALTVGGSNVLIGDYAGSGMVEDTQCVAIGKNALIQSNGGGSDGSATASNNTAVGFSAGDALTTGANNIFLGTGTDASGGGGASQIVIGVNLTGTANTRVHIGNGTSHIYNDYNTNATWTHSSDERQKKEIKNDTLGLEFINDIRPVTYKHKSPSEFPKEWNAYDENDNEPMGGDKVIHGLIAQEVKQALDKQDVDTFSGWDENPDGRQNVSFEAFVLPLIKSVQELSAEIDKLKKQLEDK